MGLPNNVLSDIAFVYPWANAGQPDPTQFTDACTGGMDIQNPNGGGLYQPWSFDTDGTNVYAASPGTGRKLIYTPGVQIEELRMCFDQNMFPFICYLNNSQWSYYWYDTHISAPTTSQLPAGVTSVACTLDDKRIRESNTSDICLFYTLNNNLYYLRQRDRYGTIYTLRNGVNATLVRAGMNVINRVQLKLRANLA